MASIHTRDMDSRAMSLLPYQIAIGVVSALLVTFIILFALTFRRLRLALYNCAILAQFSERLREQMHSQNQRANVDLERGANVDSKHSANADPERGANRAPSTVGPDANCAPGDANEHLFTIGEDEDEDNAEDYDNVSIIDDVRISRIPPGRVASPTVVDISSTSGEESDLEHQGKKA